MDEEEFKVMKDLREAKRSYKNRYEQLQKYKGSLSQATTSLDLIKMELASAFSQWVGSGSNLRNQNQNQRADSPASTSFNGGPFGGKGAGLIHVCLSVCVCVSLYLLVHYILPY